MLLHFKHRSALGADQPRHDLILIDERCGRDEGFRVADDADDADRRCKTQ
jgi:hypothetical protein